MPDYRLTDEQVQQFHDDGYVILRQRFDAEEMDLLLKIGRGDAQLANEAHGTKDAQGGVSRLTLRNHLTEGDIYSAFVQCHRIVDPMEQLFGDEVYHFHHKMMLKEPRVGGAWEWHQDYGYWYKFNHCLWPDMGSALIAVDRANKANGCLQVLKGSHKCGRIEHGTSGTQTGADMQRVEQLMKRLELVYVELEPGDLLIFHSNTLHRSDQNRSENPRWSLICCYNTKHNDPFVKIERGHPNYSYLQRIDDSQIKEIGRKQLADMQANLSQTV
jgi:ectoine hydroxylase-related dioxygenase (phytanoyl-CoA dioxygenase family)